MRDLGRGVAIDLLVCVQKIGDHTLAITFRCPWTSAGRVDLNMHVTGVSCLRL